MATPARLDTVAVIGNGIIGHGVAQKRSEASLERAMVRIRESLARFVASRGMRDGSAGARPPAHASMRCRALGVRALHTVAIREGGCQKVQEISTGDLQNMGLGIDSFTIRDIRGTGEARR